MATHDMDYAFGWADEIVLMHEGRVLKKGMPLEVCADRKVLEKTNLEMPAVLRLYEKMKEKEWYLHKGRYPEQWKNWKGDFCDEKRNPRGEFRDEPSGHSGEDDRGH